MGSVLVPRQGVPGLGQRPSGPPLLNARPAAAFLLASGLSAEFLLPNAGPGHPEGASAGRPNPGRGRPLHAE